MDIYSIYRITNKINNKVYIGYTENVKKRFRDHKNIIKNERVEFVLYESIRKHGIENFDFEVIFQSKDKYHTFYIMEPYFIKEYNSHYRNNMGYNMTHGGDGCFDEYQKKIISEKITKQWKELDQSKRIKNMGMALKKKWSDPDHYNKMLEIRRNQWKKEENQHIILKWKQNAKKYIVIDPDGNECIIDNLRDFCKEHGLGQHSKMYAVANGKLKHYRGWKCRLLTEEKQTV